MFSEEARFQMKKDLIRERLLKYTRKAFQVLPRIDKPRILDIGCGTGIQTLELARLSQGEIVALDIDQPALDELNRKIREVGLTNRIRAVNCSMFDIDFAHESFDIVWSEGSIYAIGFERGLWEWKRFLKPGGLIVVHDEQGNINEKLKQISDCGYDLLSYFILSKEILITQSWLVAKRGCQVILPKYTQIFSCYHNYLVLYFQITVKRQGLCNGQLYFRTFVYTVVKPSSLGGCKRRFTHHNPYYYSTTHPIFAHFRTVEI